MAASALRERGNMARRNPTGFGELERAIDEIFDELLIDPWRCRRGEEFERSEILDLPERYEVRLAAEGIDAREIEVEVFGSRLTVRAPAGERGRIESSFAFDQAIDGDAATARWSQGALTIVIPKRKGRRIVLKES
jgi:HSP20 family molecular chaperone IbpA